MRRGRASRLKLAEIGQLSHAYGRSLDWFRSRIVSAGHVVGRIGKRLACLVGVLLEPGAGFSDCVLRTVIPGDTRLAVDISPFAVYIADRAVGFAAFLQRDHEGASVTIADGPFAAVAPSRRPRGVRALRPFAAGSAAAVGCVRGCLRCPPADSVRAKHSRWDGKSRTPDKAAGRIFPPAPRPPQSGLVARALPWSSRASLLHSSARLTTRWSVNDVSRHSVKDVMGHNTQKKRALTWGAEPPSDAVQFLKCLPLLIQGPMNICIAMAPQSAAKSATGMAMAPTCRNFQIGRAS